MSTGLSETRERSEISKMKCATRIYGRSRDPGMWAELSRDDIAYWITKGPNECQNIDGPFDESRQCYETKLKKNTKVTRVVRFC